MLRVAIQMFENIAPSSSTAATTCMGSRKRQKVISLEPSVRKGSNDIPSCRSSGSNNNVNNTTVATELCVDSCINKNSTVEFIPKKTIRPARICTDLSDERVLFLLTHHTNWNPFLLCLLSCVCKKTAAISDRVLWREFCLSRAPKMVSDLLLGSKNGHIDGGWQALGKLFLYCADSSKSPHFPKRNVRGHFVRTTRFSRTSGRSFLIPQCRTDTLYVSDPCEHANGPEDVGLFRGVFRGFDNSETKRLLTSKRVQLEKEEKCPFCKARGWSMHAAQMIPKSASARLAAYNENVDYFICLNGHLNGKCSLLPLSDSDASDEDN